MPINRPDRGDIRKHPIRPTTSWKPPVKPRPHGPYQGPDKQHLLLPLSLIGFIVLVALTLIVGVIATGPDTHANLWNEVRDGYERTEVIYVTSITTPPLPPGPGPGTGETSFSRDVLPIFKAKCVSCHGLGVTIKGISLMSYDDLMDTEAHEPLVVPGNPAESLLMGPLRSTASPMPPSGALPEEQILTIEKWIEQGAKDN